jgi:hypothetical protein
MFWRFEKPVPNLVQNFFRDHLVCQWSSICGPTVTVLLSTTGFNAPSLFLPPTERKTRLPGNSFAKQNSLYLCGEIWGTCDISGRIQLQPWADNQSGEIKLDQSDKQWLHRPNWSRKQMVWSLPRVGEKQCDCSWGPNRIGWRRRINPWG